jgi:hypothetical protein
MDNNTSTELNLEVELTVPPQVPGHGGARPQVKGFAASTAKATGMTKQAINRHLAIAYELGDDLLHRTTGTSLDKMVELTALTKMTPEQRARLIERAVAGEKVSAREVLAMSKPPSPAELAGLYGQAVQALRDALHLLTDDTDQSELEVTSRALARTLRASTSLKRACTLVKGVAR